AMYGVRYRGMEYPAAVPMVEALDGERSNEGYMTPAFNATKIGGLPVFVQTGIGSEFNCLGQLISLHLPPAVPFSPPSLPDGYPGSPDDNPFSPKYWPYNYGDAGTFNIILDDKGALYVLFETH
ncbi:MAG: hypothetical protein KDB61_15085, partial [Planctomycetes bacterium]|nr:hypothetical protein [Planctomycetota bacterium]